MNEKSNVPKEAKTAEEIAQELEHPTEGTPLDEHIATCEEQWVPLEVYQKLEANIPLLRKGLTEKLTYHFTTDDIPNNHGNALDTLAERLHDEIVKQANPNLAWAKIVQPIIWKWWEEQTASLVEVSSQENGLRTILGSDSKP